MEGMDPALCQTAVQVEAQVREEMQALDAEAAIQELAWVRASQAPPEQGRRPVPFQPSFTTSCTAGALDE
jgi:hypothetical protein